MNKRRRFKAKRLRLQRRRAARMVALLSDGGERYFWVDWATGKDWTVVR